MNNKFENMLDSFSDARRNGFLKVKELKDQNKNIVGVFCTYTPKELIYAANAYPVSLCSISEETIPESEKHLPKNLCPLIKASYGFALTDKCPYMYFSDLIVGETTCDGKKKMYEYLGELKDVHIMQLPHTQKGSLSKELWENEISIFKEKLESKFNTKITDEKLKEAIKLCNREREILKEFYSLGKLNPSVISGYEIQKILQGANYTFDKELQNKQILELIETFKNKYKNKEFLSNKKTPRILVTGCPLGGVVDKIIKPIEETGAIVVAYENCGGAKNLEFNVDENIDPIVALGDKYLNIPCSIMSPNSQRKELLERMVKEYEVDGVIEVVLQSCHTYAIETHDIRRHCTSLNVPFISLETDYSQSDLGQVKTRIEAFVEMI
ncbi:double-cubane-cluster-containing anaerobic reductase [uncultured Cetobacterium sp.]|uniref:double-cubane-cluster-containing anaerobic reductase n=1 Tax=uncultured Cetobacterium sp. TaxID=527638 RepID=UPI002631C9F4|nr:double-cubane-cluster-containing anaerobic reductase [uncultured Cetobacterium sp.]